MYRRTFITALTMTGLAACGGGVGLQDTVRPQMDRSYALRGFTFTAQPGLTVSESSAYYPNADIVWRGDPLGPRIPQIKTMFEDAASRNRLVLEGSVPISVDVTLVRFHGVTNRTRYTVGGVYNIVFDMTVRSADTGEVIEPTRRVVGNLNAPGGERAERLEQSGQTQRVRVTKFLTDLIYAQLV